MAAGAEGQLLGGRVATPRSARVGTAQLKVDRFRTPLYREASHQDPVLQVGCWDLPDTSRPEGRQATEGPDDGTKLYGVPKRSPPPCGRRQLAGPAPATPLEEPTLPHRRRCENPPHSGHVADEPVFQHKGRVAEPVPVSGPEGLRALPGASNNESLVSELVFNSSDARGCDAAAEFSRLLHGCAGRRPRHEAGPEGVRVFAAAPAAPAAPGELRESPRPGGRRTYAGVSEMPSDVPNMPPLAPARQADDALARLMHGAAGWRPPAHMSPAGKRGFHDAPVNMSNVDEILFGQDLDGSVNRPHNIFFGLAGRRGEGEPPPEGRRIFSTAPSQVQQVVFGGLQNNSLVPNMGGQAARWP